MNHPGFSKLVRLNVLLFLISTSGGLAMAEKYETPSYRVIESFEPIEIREYAPTLVAEVQVSGQRKKAINDGFRLLADYIFGNNAPQKKIAMTSPVNQQKGESVAMTAPVSQRQDGDLWKVQFTMPSSYTLDTLPKPNNSKVKIVAMPRYRAGAIRFSGFWREANLRKQIKKLDTFINEKQLQIKGDPTYLFYNPPWTLPFLRRNEIIYNLQK